MKDNYNDYNGRVFASHDEEQYFDINLIKIKMKNFINFYRLTHTVG
jgi:hypothetical protein